MFQTSNNLRLDSPVRIAGVNVGKVTQRRARQGLRTSPRSRWRSTTQGLPIHRTRRSRSARASSSRATSSSTSSPARPARRTVADGDTIAVTQTATPVQLDQLLTRCRPTPRRPPGPAAGLRRRAHAQADRGGGRRRRTPTCSGKTGAQALNDSLDYAPNALKGGGARQPGAARHRSRTTSRKLIAGVGEASRRRCAPTRSSCRT